MRYAKVAIIAVFVVLISSYVHAASPKTEKEWDQCRDRVSESVNQIEEGVSGVVIAIHDKCGTRPTVKTKSGETLLKTDCDWLYDQPLRECKESLMECSEGMSGLSMASQRSFILLSEKVFDNDAFNTMCIKVCQSKKMISKKNFRKTICEKK